MKKYRANRSTFKKGDPRLMGNNNPSKRPGVRAKIAEFARNRKKSKEEIEKIRIAAIAEWGNPAIRKRIIKNNSFFTKKYGKDNPFSNPQVIEKIIATRRKNGSYNFSKEWRNNMGIATTERYLKGGFKYKGYFFSQKNNSMIGYRSSDEKLLFTILEQLLELDHWQYEKDRISYIDENGQNRYTIPDVHLYWKNGSEQIIECKPEWKMKFERERLKLAAMQKYCDEKGWKFLVWSGVDIPI
jgi:hypothetical protein